jgi:8-oxo-dGTP pyrophosphatase MutT (NUDIX family)
MCGVSSVLCIDTNEQRSHMLRTHKNEVCFPGGKVDRGVDRNIVSTAIREVGEEIGIQTSHIDGKSLFSFALTILQRVHVVYCYLSMLVCERVL